MATIVNTPGSSNDSNAGWAVAVIVLLIVIAGGWYAYAHMGSREAPEQGSANINVTFPSMNDSSSGSAPSSGGDSGAMAQ